MELLTPFIFFTIVILKSVADLVSDERTDQNVRKEKNTFSKVERRFLDHLDDETWHVSHLKDTDFGARRSDCPEDTFEEKLKKYRKSLQRDGALVEYVSADALPVNETELVVAVCPAPSGKDVFQSAIQRKPKPGTVEEPSGKHNQSETTKVGRLIEKNYKFESPKATANEKKTTTETSSANLPTATTTTAKTKQSRAKLSSSRRASEYQFSSVEYYDEVFDFDASICPDAVEEIILEIDYIRNYDVVCEQTLQWRSLE